MKFLLDGTRQGKPLEIPQGFGVHTTKNERKDGEGKSTDKMI